jgi:putative phage-type endonuclease
MPIIHYNYEQGSFDWFKARKKYKITASLVGSIIAASANSKTYQRLVVEKATGVSTDFSTPAIVHGVDCEPLARARLKEKYPSLVEVGLIHNTKYPDFAASPDGIILKPMTTLVEIKCPYSRKMGKTIPTNYWHQMQFQMLVTDIMQCLYAEFKYTQVDHKFERSWQKLVKFDTNWYTDNCDKITKFIEDVKNYCWLDHLVPTNQIEAEQNPEVVSEVEDN